MPKMNIFEYERSRRHTYGPTLKNKARRIAYETFFTVTYPLFARFGVITAGSENALASYADC
jgi:hypothetical protein